MFPRFALLFTISALGSALGLLGCNSTASSGTGSGTGSGSTTGASAGTAGSPTSGGTTGENVWARDGGPTVTVTTLAGNGVAAFHDGSGGHTGAAEFVGPNGVAVDASGNVYVADTLGHRIRRIDSSGNVTTLAGNGSAVYHDGTGGPSGTASFGYPSGLAVSTQGFLLVSDDGVNRIRKVDLSDGTTTTFAGNGSPGFADGTGGATGQAKFNFNDYQNYAFSGLCSDGNDHFFVADPTNNAIRTVDASGNVGTLAGSGARGWADGLPGAAKFNSPGSCVTDQAGNVYVADFGNSRVRKIDGAGNVTTVSGNGTDAYRDGTGGPQGTAEIFRPAGIAYDPVSGTLFAPDTFADFIQHLSADGTATTIAGSSTGWQDGDGAVAKFNAPAGIAIDPQGRLVVVDFFGADVRILTFQ